MNKFLVIFCTALLLLEGCANRVVPEGGPKDTKPPVVVKSVPDNGSLNFKGKSIVISFDEYVQVTDLAAQLVVSPLMEPTPKVTAFKNSISIHLPDTLQDETTYLLSFGKAISDIHESNALDGYKFVFSTGDKIDSLKVDGTVVDGATGRPLKLITVMMYRTTSLADSILLKRKPDYFARTDEAGTYHLSNLAPGSYVLAALEDKNGNYRYDDPSEEGLAFNTSLLNLPGDSVVNFRLTYSLPEKLRLKRVTRMGKTAVQLVFNRPVEQMSLKDRNGVAYSETLYWNSRRDTLMLFMRDTLQDSLKLIVSGERQLQDTILQKMQFSKNSREASPSKVYLSIARTPAVTGLESPFILESLTPITELKEIQLTEDSITVKEVKFYIDTVDNRRMVISYAWKPASNYRINLLPSAIKDQFGYVNDSLEYKFKTPDELTTGELQVKINGSANSTSQYLLELCSEDYKMLRRVLVDSTKYSFSFVQPGSYRLRLINDTNRNGRWDESDYADRKQPEHIVVSDAFQVRAGWTLDKELEYPE